jgi:hypothetical protein
MAPTSSAHRRSAEDGRLDARAFWPGPTRPPICACSWSPCVVPFLPQPSPARPPSCARLPGPVLPALPGPVLPALPLALAAGRRAPPCCRLAPVPPAACHTLTLRSPRARRAILGSPLSAHDWLTYTTASWPRRSPVQPRIPSSPLSWPPWPSTPGLQFPRLLRHRHPRLLSSSSPLRGLPVFRPSRPPPFLSDAPRGLLLSPFIHSPPHLNTRFLSTLHLLPVPGLPPFHTIRGRLAPVLPVILPRVRARPPRHSARSEVDP